jgi:hypothetical protein
MEYGYKAVQEAMSMLAKKNKDIWITLQELRKLMVEADSIFEEELALSLKDEEGTASKYDAEQKLNNIFDTLVERTWEEHKMEVTSSVSMQSNDKVEPTSPVGLARTYKSRAISSPKSSPKTSAGKDSDNNSTVGISTPNLRKRKPTSMYIDSPERKDIPEGVKKAEERQADSVKKQRQKKTEGVRKQVLEVDDIYTLILEGNVKAPLPYLPCMMMTVAKSRYSTCTRDGHLKGTFNRNQLDFKPTYVGSILGIDTSVEGFRTNMSVKQACNIYGQEDSSSYKGDCNILS